MAFGIWFWAYCFCCLAFGFWFLNVSFCCCCLCCCCSRCCCRSCRCCGCCCCRGCCCRRCSGVSAPWPEGGAPSPKPLPRLRFSTRSLWHPLTSFHFSCCQTCVLLLFVHVLFVVWLFVCLFVCLFVWSLWLQYGLLMLCVILLRTALLFVELCCWYLCFRHYYVESTTSPTQICHAEMNVVILKNEQIEITVFRSNICHNRIIRTMVHLKSMEHIERWQGCVYMKEIEKWSKSWAEISNKWHEYIDNFKKMCSSTQEIGEILRESNKDSAEQYTLKTLRKNCTTCASLVQWRVQYVAVRSCYLLPIISSFVCRELMLELCPCASTIFYFARFADCHLWYKLGPQRLAFTLTPDAHFQIFLRFTRHRNRICPQESRPSQMVGKRMSNCVAVKPTIAISATWLIRSWCSWFHRWQGGKAACWVSVLASKSSNLITAVTVGCHTLDHIPCQIQSCPETIKELWEKHGKTCFKVTYFDSCRTCIAHTVVASLRTTLTQLRPVRWQTAAWDLIQESPAEVMRIETVA